MSSTYLKSANVCPFLRKDAATKRMIKRYHYDKRHEIEMYKIFVFIPINLEIPTKEHTLQKYVHIRCVW